MKLSFLLLTMLSAYQAIGQSGPAPGFPGQAKEIVKVDGLDIPVYDFNGIQPNFDIDDGRVHVVNFWATWCKPCVEELPHFIRLAGEMDTQKVTFLFVSLDFRKNLESRLAPFVKEHGMQGKVALLQDPDANAWIDQVDKDWSGAIPATLIYRGKERQFFESLLSYEELKSKINNLIKD